MKAMEYQSLINVHFSVNMDEFVSYYVFKV